MKKLNIYAYVGPTNGEYVLADGTRVQNEDFRTVERYQEYKDCGFDTLLLLGNDPYNGEEFSESQLKKNLDMCAQVGLQCIVYDKRIHDLSMQDDGIIGEGKPFADEKALEEYLSGCIVPYKGHSAFFGLELGDEPRFQKLKSFGQIYKAFSAMGEKVFFNSVLFPYFNNNEAYYTDNEALKGVDSYVDYIERWFRETDAESIDYDYYPFKFLRDPDCATDPTDSYVEVTHFINLQLMSETARRLGKKFYITLQAYASATTAGSAYKRRMRFPDFRYQLNAAFAFGAKDLRYYTYWTFPSQIGDPTVEAIMSPTGEKQYYDFVKQMNEEAQKQAEYVLDYDYVATVLCEKEQPKFEKLVSLEAFEGASVEANCAVIFNKMQNKSGATGYYVMNAEDPATDITANVRIVFEGADSVAVYQNGEKEIRVLQNGVFVQSFPVGEGAFLTPIYK